MKKLKRYSQKIVVKVGSSILTGGGTTIVAENLKKVVGHIAHFCQEGKSIIVVTSGAIASGLAVLGLKKKPKELELLQAAAAAGQNILMQSYSHSLSHYGLKCAQILLTKEDFQDRQRYLNARNTINALLKCSVIPIINENDAISIDEIKFGDNDTLSARVAAAVEADGLLILTDIEGVYDRFNAKTGARGNLLKDTPITPEVEKMACGTDKDSCVGGMSTKIAAAKIATRQGIPTIITSSNLDSLSISFKKDSGEYFDGTRFSAVAAAKNSKKHWLAYEAKVKGSLVVDDGAKKALIDGGKSLLACGIHECRESFKQGDVVAICDKQGQIFAKGKVNFSSSDIVSILGKKAKKEVIHCDELSILE